MKVGYVILSAALAVIFIPALLFAQQGVDPNITNLSYINACKRFKILSRSIDLSPEQKTNVANLLAEYRTDVLEVVPELWQAKKNLFITMHVPREVIDQDEVRTAYQAVSAIEEDIAIIYTLLMNNIFQVVEPWQYKRIVAANVNLRVCSMAPVRLYRRHLDRWINKHKTVN